MQCQRWRRLRHLARSRGSRAGSTSGDRGLSSRRGGRDPLLWRQHDDAQFCFEPRTCSAFARGDEVVITQLDHEADRGPWLSLAAQGTTVPEVALGSDGALDAEALERALTSRTRIVALERASNALGTVTPTTGQFMNAAGRVARCWCATQFMMPLISP